MQVTVQDDKNFTSFEMRRVYQAGDLSVTMLSDGAMLLA